MGEDPKIIAWRLRVSGLTSEAHCFHEESLNEFLSALRHLYSCVTVKAGPCK